MLHKLWMAAWFMWRPRLYPELWRRVRKNVLHSRHPGNDTGPDSLETCEKVAISSDEAIEAITGKPVETKLAQLFPSIFHEAEKKYLSSPVIMGGPGDIELLYHLCEYSNAVRVVETGVAHGWSTLAILLSLRNRKESMLVSIDMPYPNLNNEDFVGWLVPSSLHNQWQLLRMADKEALPRALERCRNVDLFHYDSDKSYEGRTWAYSFAWEYIRCGGIFISDDISDNMAFFHFSMRVGVQPLVVKKTGGGYVGIIIKPR